MLADTIVWVVGIVAFLFAVHSVASVPKEIIKQDSRQENNGLSGDNNSLAR